MNWLRFSGCVLCLSASAGIVVSSEALCRLAESTHRTEANLDRVVSELPVIVNTQLDRTNDIISKRTGQITLQVGTVANSASRLATDLHETLAGVDNTTAQLKEVAGSATVTLNSLNKVVSDPDIPALIRDARVTVALTGSTMAHVRSTANTIAQAAPDMAASVNKIAGSTAGITSDVHSVTTDLTKPKPWWKQLLSIASAGARIGSTVF